MEVAHKQQSVNKVARAFQDFDIRGPDERLEQHQHMGPVVPKLAALVCESDMCHYAAVH